MAPTLVLRVWPLCLGMAVGVVVLPARAGTIRHDRDDSLYTGLAAEAAYSNVGRVFVYKQGGGGQVGSGVLISSRWVLTAGHLTYDPSGTTTNIVFHFSAESYSSAVPNGWITHSFFFGDVPSDGDIGLVKLATPFDISPGSGITVASRYAGSGEVGLVGTSVGYGLTGTGLTGATAGTYGTKRAGQNVIDVLGSTSGIPLLTEKMLMIDFDHPNDPSRSRWGSTSPLDLEYTPAPGDSGGGLFIDVGGQTRLAGITSFGYPTSSALYGDAAGYMRVSQFNLWIDDRITVPWNNPGGGSFSTANNWIGQAVPTANDIVGFNIDGTYTVTFPSDVTSERILARRGHATLDMGGHTYSVTSPTLEGSIIVGRYSGNDATLTLLSGTLASRMAVIAEQSGSTGRINVGSGATWNANGALYLGGSALGPGGSGTVTVASGGALNVTGMIKAYSGGTLTFSGGTVSAASVELAGGTLRATTTASLAAPLLVSGSAVQVDAGVLTHSGSLTLAAGATLTKSGAGTFAVAGSQSHGAGAAISVTGGLLSMLSDAGAGGANLALAVGGGAAASFETTQHLKSLSIASGAMAAMQGDGRVLRLTSLSIAGDASPLGLLDLGGNAMIIDYDPLDGSPLATVRSQIAAGYGSGGWSGTSGITTSMGTVGTHGLGLAEASELFGSFPATFAGESIDSSSVLVKFTYYGDTTLSGSVGLDDLSITLANYGQIGGWTSGDFNYDGVVGFADLGLLLNNYSGGGLSLDADALQLLESYGFSVAPIVPEPAGLGLLGLAGALALRRRVRRG